jgi:hypothetical protein
MGASGQQGVKSPHITLRSGTVEYRDGPREKMLSAGSMTTFDTTCYTRHPHRTERTTS